MGSFRIAVDDGRYRRVVDLDRAYYGLYLPPLIWAEELEFSAGAICLVLASLPYDEADYIRDYGSCVAEAVLKRGHDGSRSSSVSSG